MLVDSDFIFMNAEEHVEKALEDVRRLKHYYQKGYKNKSWEDRKVEVIKSLISAEDKLQSALLDIESIHYKGHDL